MDGFNLKEYQTKNSNTKIKVFIEFLYEKFGLSIDDQSFDNDYFLLFNEDDLIESLNYYIYKNSVTAQITANNYVTYITDFFEMLSDKYNIRNDIFINVDRRNNFMLKVKEIVSLLKQTENKEIASDDQYEKLNSDIDNFLSTCNERDIIAQINDLKGKEIKTYFIYHRFVSVVAIKLVMSFALKNKTVISLNASDLDMEKKNLSVNGISLPLNTELLKLLEMYLRIREFILRINLIKESKLFIKHNGEPYIKETPERKNTPDYGKFFLMLKESIETRSAELFAAKRILEMLNKGIDISTITKLSDWSSERCINLINSHIDEEEANERLQHFFKNKLTVNKKGYFKCPFCGNDVRAVSNELVLVQYENDPVKYLACAICKGKNENARSKNI